VGENDVCVLRIEVGVLVGVNACAEIAESVGDVVVVGWVAVSADCAPRR
jgi:hypothetical protein